MSAPETEMEMVVRHIAQSERHIQEQRMRITRLREAGAPIELAEELLHGMGVIQAKHQDHMDRLLAKNQT